MGGARREGSREEGRGGADMKSIELIISMLN